MTESEFLALPDRERDAMVTKRIMIGWRPRNYTTTWDGAGMVVQRMEKEGWLWSMEQLYRESRGRVEWRVRLGRPGVGDEDIWVFHEAWGEDLRPTVSLAALKAKGVVE